MKSSLVSLLVLALVATAKADEHTHTVGFPLPSGISPGNLTHDFPLFRTSTRTTKRWCCG